MSNVQFNPGKEAVSIVQVTEVAPAVPTTVTLTLSPQEAGELRAVLGACIGSSLFHSLRNLAADGLIPNLVLRQSFTLGATPRFSAGPGAAGFPSSFAPFGT